MHFYKAGSVWLQLVLAACCCTLFGCAAPLSAYRDFAHQQGWQESLISTSRFKHRVWLKPGTSAKSPGLRSTSIVHVYIEGDGRAWESASMPSSDPTSRAAIMFSLMALDPAPAIYVGRPCYFHTDDARCDARWWTFQRYSDEIVASMADVIASQAGDAELTLIGHSGGGSLAVLIAPRLANVSAVVTLAGNLDVEAWTRAHGYMPLTGSLDPISQPPLPSAIVQWHFSAAQDDVIPPAVLEHYCKKQIQQQREYQSQRQQRSSTYLQCDVAPGTTHGEGWALWWQDFVKQLVAAGH